MTPRARTPHGVSQVIAVALQASAVGSRLQSFYGSGEGRAPGAEADLITASLLLALLLIALWSLLSQLLAWSDAAVLKVCTARAARPRLHARARQNSDSRPRAALAAAQIPSNMHVTPKDEGDEEDAIQR